MKNFWQDIRYGARMLWKSPGFTVVAVAALALGIGANTAIFSVVNALLLRPLALEEADRLVILWSQSKATGANSASSYPDFADFRAQNQTLEGVAAFRPHGATLTEAGEPERLPGARVSADFFPVLRVTPLAGRTFLPEEDAPGAERVCLITYGLWQRKFGGDPTIVGRAVTLDERPHTVVGILPRDFHFPYTLEDAEVYSTIAYEGNNLNERGARTGLMLARLKEGATLEQAAADVAGIAARLEAQYPDRNTGLGATVVTLREQLTGEIERALWVLLGAVALVLLIACTNVANLLLVRASVRQREVAIRTAMGASRWRIVRQLLTESLLLAALAGALGLLLAVWGVELLVSVSPADLPRLDAVRLDRSVLLFTLGVSVLTGFVFGLAPALKASKAELVESLKEGGRSTNMRPGRQRLRGLLVVAEVAVALVLLVGAGLLSKSFLRLQSVDPGFDARGVLTMRINLPRARYAEGESRARFVGDVVERMRTLPGATSAAFVTPVPFSFNNVGAGFEIEGRPPAAPGEEPGASFRGVTPGYFQTMNIRVVRGRDFDERDRRGAQTGAAVINETAAARYFAGEDPVGKVIKGVGVGVDEDEPERWEIVGVVSDVRHQGLDTEPLAEIYLPHRQQSWGWGFFVVRAGVGDAAALAAPARAQVRAVDPAQAVSDVRTLEEMISGSIARPRFYALLLAVFAGVGLVLAAVGIYGVLSYAVTERTHEIGIRMALGAQGRDILRMVVRSGMTYTLCGVVLGLAGALAVTRVLSTLLFGVSAYDPGTYAVIALLLAAVALLACYLPARRATKVDPMVALRYE